MHTNSRNIDQLRRDVQSLELQCKRSNVPISAPDDASEIDPTPMLGHTKGNTKSNRKKIKHAQQVLLVRTRAHLETILIRKGINPCTRNESNDNDDDDIVDDDDDVSDGDDDVDD